MSVTVAHVYTLLNRKNLLTVFIRMSAAALIEFSVIRMRRLFKFKEVIQFIIGII